MASKKHLLKQLGWSDELIRHYLIDDADYVETTVPELGATAYDTNSFTINADQIFSRNAVTVMGKCAEKGTILDT